MSRFAKFSVLIGCSVFVIVPVIAADEGDSGGDERAAMMAEMMKYGTPGEHHEHLKSLAGTWKLASRFRMTEDGDWDDSTGDSKFEWILGGRFLQQTVKTPPSEAMPVAFEGFGLLGYDNLAKEYISIWMDNFFTGAMVFTGSCDDSGKVITFAGEYNDPARGGALTKEKWVFRIINNDKFIFEMHKPSESGKEYMHGEITYTRVK